MDEYAQGVCIISGIDIVIFQAETFSGSSSIQRYPLGKLDPSSALFGCIDSASASALRFYPHCASARFCPQLVALIVQVLSPYPLLMLDGKFVG